ncbi:MFS maltose permease [Fusarium subglutinans]|uniref:MFS maltose permease n=1 Tax=Gibberella subglutinans TaxID=42677 RepID=A0A8H5PJA3_GIBSU|nr:MFS maltose permease [Fusarium subglutinans]KAF5597502.1 MFS maltose permease [Fusarium subglutinans]
MPFIIRYPREIAPNSIPCVFFAAATPSYAAEVAPLQLNGYLTVYVNLCWVMGKMISFGVLTSMLKYPTEWSYRIPFAIQWGWPPFMIVAIFLAPDLNWPDSLWYRS